MPADAVYLGQREFSPELIIEHSPEPFLELFGVGARGDFILVDHQMIRQQPFPGVIRYRLLNLFARDIGKDDTPAPGHDQIAAVGLAGLPQMRVPRQHVDYAVGVAPRLLQRMRFGHHAVVCQQRDIRLADLLQRVWLPVLDLEKEQSPRRMKNDEIGVTALPAYGNVVPDKIIILQQFFQASCDPLLTGGHPA